MSDYLVNMFVISPTTKMSLTVSCYLGSRYKLNTWEYITRQHHFQIFLLPKSPLAAAAATEAERGRKKCLKASWHQKFKQRD